MTLMLGSDSVAVQNTGRGIADKDLKHVQQRFFRPAGQVESGSGLGLSIVHRIAELHGLRFYLENHIEGGAVAYLVANERS